MKQWLIIFFSILFLGLNNLEAKTAGCRFSVDPLAEVGVSITPYGYCGNNPLVRGTFDVLTFVGMGGVESLFSLSSSLCGFAGKHFGRTAIKTSLQAAKVRGINAFRYMNKAELQAIQKTGLLRGGRVGETFFTKDLYKSAIHAQQRLALPSVPTLRVEFQILNNPTLLRSGTKIQSAFGMSGGGAEFMTLDPVKIKLINWQPLR